jgi:histidine ammonia-lyase
MISLDGNSLTLDQLITIARGGAAVGIADSARARILAARALVDEYAHHDDPTYGINTGFGNFAEVKIPEDSLSQLQINLVRSHSAGVGEPLPVDVVRAMMALRANVLAKGFSGVRLETLELLVELLNRQVHPVVPSRGSVGASGDLAPLAHLALVLIGEGTALRGDAPVAGGEALAKAGLKAAVLQAKEGLALINGTQASTALLGLSLADSSRLARAADIAAALSLDALRGSTRPFDPRIHDARGFGGQRTSAENLRNLLDGSPINDSHANCGRVQDAYSLRCTPQVHGAAREALGFARGVFDTEANAATDNPMVFADGPDTARGDTALGDIVSGGNFHGAPVAVASDVLCLALAQLATISERRCDRLVNPALSGLPAFLTRHGGLESGLMMAQVTAAAIASEIKTLAHPASVDTIPTSGNREDHVSMSMSAGLKAARAADLARHAIACELLCACEAIDLLAPLRSSAPLMRAHDFIRERVPAIEHDRSFSPDLRVISDMIVSGSLERSCGVDVN